MKVPVSPHPGQHLLFSVFQVFFVVVVTSPPNGCEGSISL